MKARCVTDSGEDHQLVMDFERESNDQILARRPDLVFVNSRLCSWEDKGVHAFPKGICPKMNIIVRLEYELTYYDSAVHRFNHYTTRTQPFGQEKRKI